MLEKLSEMLNQFQPSRLANEIITEVKGVVKGALTLSAAQVLYDYTHAGSHYIMNEDGKYMPYSAFSVSDTIYNANRVLLTSFGIACGNVLYKKVKELYDMYHDNNEETQSEPSQEDRRPHHKLT